MESHLTRYSRPKESPPAVFSLASCLCGDDYDETENGDLRRSSPWPTIAISPVLLRRFTPVTRYLNIQQPSPEIDTKQPAVRFEMQKMVDEKKTAVLPMPKLNRRGYVNVSEQQSTQLTLSSSKPQELEYKPYKYGPLGDDEIRVVILDEAKYTEETVIQVQVRKRTAVARYEAVSYAWGLDEETTKIKVRTEDGIQTLKVRINVVTMLRQLRERRPLEPLWIDAICINQGLKTEKDRQVPMMADVYGRASQTLVWLGHGEVRHGGKIYVGEPLLSNLDRAWPYSKAIDEVRNNVEPLLTDHYFTRRWIIQELFFSKKVCLLDRYGTLDFRVLEDASEFVLKHVHHLHHDGSVDRRFLNALHLMHILRELRIQSSDPASCHDHMRLLVSAHISNCKEDVDRLYALGALEKEKRPVKYGTSVEDLFADFAKEECERSMETLYCSGTFPDKYGQPKTKTLAVNAPTEGKQPRALPSWVPDWRSPRVWIPVSLLHKRDVSETSFGAQLRDFTHPPQHPWRVESTNLVVHGAIIGTVSHVTRIATIGGLMDFYKRPNSAPAFCTDIETPADISHLVRTLTLDSVQQGRIAQPWLDRYHDSNGTRCPLEDHKSRCNHRDSDSDSESRYECNTLRRIEDVMTGRCAFVTKEGHWAVGPESSKKGDCMVRLDGCRFPFVMRRQANGTWRIVGDCYSETRVGEVYDLNSEFCIV